MKESWLLLLGVIAPLVFSMVGCATRPKADPTAFTEQALAATENAKRQVASPKDEADAVARFKAFNSDFSPANIASNTASVYAADVYFRDPFKEIHGEPDFQTYLMHSAESVAEFSMDWKDVAKNDGDYYFRWVMTLKMKRESEKTPAAKINGISHVRFGGDGKVIFHQDYFDAAAFLYEKIPILGAEIRFIKKRL